MAKAIKPEKLSTPAADKAAQETTQVKGKKEMVRLVRTTAGVIEIDTTGKKEGRGAYLCRDWTCWGKSAKGQTVGARF